MWRPAVLTILFPHHWGSVGKADKNHTANSPCKIQFECGVYSLQYEGSMLGVEEALHQVRNTGKAEPAYLCRGSRVKGRDGEQSMQFLLHFPFPSAPWFYSCWKDQVRTVQNCWVRILLWGLRQAVCSAEAGGQSLVIGQKTEQLERLQGTDSQGLWCTSCRHKQDSLGWRYAVEPCLGKIKNQKHFLH